MARRVGGALALSFAAGAVHNGTSYGDARLGGGAFADVVGVVCAGACYAEAATWSAVAVRHGPTAVESAASCAALGRLEGAAAFAFAGGRCELLAAAAAAPALGNAPAGGVAGNCSDAPWLPFPDGVDAGGSAPAGDGDDDDACFARGFAYCPRSTAVGVVAAPAALRVGAAQRWWDGADVADSVETNHWFGSAQATLKLV